MKIVIWILRIVLCVAFLLSGMMKLTGNPMAVEMFGKIGFGQWFRYLTGVLEVIGALWVIIPRFSVAGSSLLACVMAGAVSTHLFIVGGSPLPAIILLCVSLLLTYLQRGQFGKLLGR